MMIFIGAVDVTVSTTAVNQQVVFESGVPDTSIVRFFRHRGEPEYECTLADLRAWLAQRPSGFAPTRTISREEYEKMYPKVKS